MLAILLTAVSSINFNGYILYVMPIYNCTTMRNSFIRTTSCVTGTTGLFSDGRWALHSACTSDVIAVNAN